MEPNRRYTTMVFPQGFDGNKLALNIVLIPRNQDPFAPFATGLMPPDPGSVAAFADLEPTFEIKVAKGLDQWPISNASTLANRPASVPVTVAAAAQKKTTLQTIAESFGAKINVDNTVDRIEEVEYQVSKYLPESYRRSFNFTTPRHPNAKTDDSYQCAIRKEAAIKKDWKNDDRFSWGQVYAHILRQPALAKQCGMIYSAEVAVEAHPEWFSKGAYIYVDIMNADYAAVQAAFLAGTNGPFVKRYAARLPKLIVGKERPVFAPILFPVLYQQGAADPEPQKAPWDAIFAETSAYNDGYAKIVHANQPVSSNLLSEAQDGTHPVNDAGIRLAWDDEQILIWYLRQLTFNPDDGKRLDAPLGVYGYQVDVREKGVADWDCLNRVKASVAQEIGGIAAGEELLLPFQVFPTQPDNNTKSSYWLPMYFTGWIGKSLVLKDKDAVKIYHNQSGIDAVGGSKAVSADMLFDEVPTAAKLIYGHSYDFRVRLMDISGGSPDPEKDGINAAGAPTASWLFQRYIAPGLCRMEKPLDLFAGRTSFYNELVDDDDETIRSFDANPVMRIKRPLLTYPAVVFTGKYDNAVDLLISAPQVETDKDGKQVITPARADPDVIKVLVRVEVETLRMDNLLSKNGQENYASLYVTTRDFPEDFDGELTIPVVFKDVNALKLGDTVNAFAELGLTNVDIDGMAEILLPTARKVRITLRAVCKDETNYYGFINEENHDLDSRYGKTTQLLFYKESAVEDDLFRLAEGVAPVKAIYLQPDPEPVNLAQNVKVYYNVEQALNLPNVVQRLAQQLGVVAKGMTLVSKKGHRVVFGCSNKIQHHLAPDQSSITFGSKSDLANHWIGCLVYHINRDWSWDALENVGFSITRNKKFRHDADEELETVLAGDVEIKRYASFESLAADDYGNVNRDHTTLIFIDAVEPKSMLTTTGGGLRFPDELEVDYTLVAHFKPNHSSNLTLLPDKLLLPTTVIPAQVPKIVSVGIAFSPYRRNEKYSATEPRQRFLWIELSEAVKDPHDTLFCRVLKYAPDQLIGVLESWPEENTPDPPLPIDPEYIRSITPGQTDDMAGLSAMQAMEKASDGDDLHYLLPLPTGLHSESPELFGFFTYEFRIGHTHRSNLPDGADNLWSTAQGRFGRPRRVTGMQHPAPTLLCTVNRDEEKLYVNAPYATAVYQGKDVTADPPRTQMHCVLYAQVRQADGQDYRNILLQARPMTLVEPRPERPVNNFLGLLKTTILPRGGDASGLSIEQAKMEFLVTHLGTVRDLSTLSVDDGTRSRLQQFLTDRFRGKPSVLDHNSARTVLDALRADNDKLPVGSTAVAAAAAFTTDSLLLGAQLATYRDKVKTAECLWTNKEIDALLTTYGLPEDLPLSVLAVEVFGNISSVFDQFNMTEARVQQLTANKPDILSAMQGRRARSETALTDNLGKYRILRTSPLTEVPFVCCTV